MASLVVAWVGLAVWLALPGIATATEPGSRRVPSPVGTVDTVAGPGFCSGPAAADAASAAVGGLAADAGGAGSLWFETGDVGEGRVTRVASTTSVVVVSTGAVPPATEGPGGAPRGAASAGRLAGDGSGGLFVAKPTAVLRLGEGLETVAGTASPPTAGTAPSGGDGGPLAGARFRHVAAIAADAAGNVYVADEVDPRAATVAVRFLNRGHQFMTFYPGTAAEVTVPPGTVGTILGGGGVSDASATPAAPLVAPAPVLAVAEGRLYLGFSRGGSRPRGEVRLVNLSGGDLAAHGVRVGAGRSAVVATVEGARRPVTQLAGRPPSGPLPGIAADAAGNLFLADAANHRVLRVDAGGTVTTFAGTGAAGFNGNDRAATTARLDRPYDVEVGPAGRVYIADAGNGLVRFVDSGGAIHAALGNGAGIRWRCRGAGAVSGSGHATQVGPPSGLAADASGNVYVTLPGLGQVHRLVASGGLRPVVGRPRGAPCGDPAGCGTAEGAAASATDLGGASTLALHPRGGLYVHDGGRVRLLNLGRRPLRLHGVVVAPGTVRTVAGRSAAGRPDPSPVPAGDGGPALEADVSTVRAMVVDRRGTLFLADLRGGVRQVDATGTVTTLLPAPAPTEGGGTDRSPCCAVPAGLALDRTGNLYVADGARVWFHNRSGRAVEAHGVRVAPGAVEPVAGSAAPASQGEGERALEASLPDIASVAADRVGNLYLVTMPDHTVRRVDPTGALTAVVGNGQRGFNGDGLKGALTALDRPVHVVVDACGNLLVADTGNDRVRRLNVVAACPARASAAAIPTADRPTGAVVAVAAAALAAGLVALALGRRGRRAGRGGSRGAAR